jgi:DNA-binding NarL/FixJ family response regulator
MITVFLVDDQSSTRAVLRLRLELEADIVVIGETGNDEDTVAQVVAAAPDVVVLDVSMPMHEGDAISVLLRSFATRFAVVVLSLYDGPTTRAHAIAAGARTLVSKHAPDDAVMAAIRAAVVSPAPPSPA